MTEVLVALVGFAGLAIPAYLNLFTGESRELKNLAARIELVRTMPEELSETKDNLIRSINEDTRPPDPNVTSRFPIWLTVVLVTVATVSLWAFAKPERMFPDQPHGTVEAWALVALALSYSGLLLGMVQNFARNSRMNRTILGRTRSRNDEG